MGAHLLNPLMGQGKKILLFYFSAYLSSKFQNCTDIVNDTFISAQDSAAQPEVSQDQVSSMLQSLVPDWLLQDMLDKARLSN